MGSLRDVIFEDSRNIFLRELALASMLSHFTYAIPLESTLANN